MGDITKGDTNPLQVAEKNIQKAKRKPSRNTTILKQEKNSYLAARLLAWMV
jgi:hypothetical protein